jgi:hypothetical protein
MRLSLPLQQRNHCLMTMTIWSSREDHESLLWDEDCASYKSRSLLGWRRLDRVKPECFSWVENSCVWHWSTCLPWICCWPHCCVT